MGNRLTDSNAWGSHGHTREGNLCLHSTWRFEFTAGSTKSLAVLPGRFPFRPSGPLCRRDASPRSGGHISSPAGLAPTYPGSFRTEAVEGGERRVNLFHCLLCPVAFRLEVYDYGAEINHVSPRGGIVTARTEVRR
jgi:hypothetical protein